MAIPTPAVIAQDPALREAASTTATDAQLEAIANGPHEAAASLAGERLRARRLGN